MFQYFNVVDTKKPIFIFILQHNNIERKRVKLISCNSHDASYNFDIANILFISCSHMPFLI